MMCETVGNGVSMKAMTSYGEDSEQEKYEINQPINNIKYKSYIIKKILS